MNYAYENSDLQCVYPARAPLDVTPDTMSITLQRQDQDPLGYRVDRTSAPLQPYLKYRGCWYRLRAALLHEGLSGSGHWTVSVLGKEQQCWSYDEENQVTRPSLDGRSTFWQDTQCEWITALYVRRDILPDGPAYGDPEVGPGAARKAHTTRPAGTPVVPRRRMGITSRRCMG